MSTAARKRLTWIDTGKYLCIMCVMLSHLESGAEALSRLYSPFFLTTFLFLSGYVFKSNVSFREHLQKKLRGLFVPWLLLSNLNILLSALVTLKGKRTGLTDVAWNLLQIRGCGDGVWFVAALFAAYIPFYFVARAKRPTAWSIALFLALCGELYWQFMPADILPWHTIALPWHLDYIGYAMLWMLCGYEFRRSLETSFDKYRKLPQQLAVCLVYLALVYLLPDGIGALAVAISYLRSVVGVCAIVSLCKTLPNCRYVSFVGANTLVYFALHGKLYAVLEALLHKFAGGIYAKILSQPLLSGILAVVITLVMSIILLIPAWIINRWFPWVLGRSTRKKTPR